MVLKQAWRCSVPFAFLKSCHHIKRSLLIDILRRHGSGVARVWGINIFNLFTKKKKKQKKESGNSNNILMNYPETNVKVGVHESWK